VCKQTDGTFESHFRFKPDGFARLVGKDLLVSADDCEDLTACPDLDPRPGPDNINQVVLTGTFRQRVQQTNEYTNLIHGGRSWSTVGPSLGSAALSKDTGVRLAAADPSQAAIDPQSAEVPNLDCMASCFPGDEYCLRYTLPDRYAVPMRQFAKIVSDPSRTSMAKADLLKLFAEANDECNRSDITFASSTVRNQGEECVMTAEINPSTQLAIRVLLPGTLEGKWQPQSPTTFLTFPSADTAPIVAFNDEDWEYGFGGEVRRVWVQPSELIVETFNGCSRVSY
jgi:hypothetical protein